MLPRFEIVARHREVAVVGPTVGRDGRLPLLAPYGAVEAVLSAAAPPTRVRLVGPDDTALTATWDGRSVSLAIDGTTHRSRRHGRARSTPSRLALTLTGNHVAALTLEDGQWVVRCRVDLTTARPDVDVHDPAWLAGLQYDATTPAVSAGVFGQLGLRDIRLVTWADGAPYRAEGEVLFTATSAGPGFFPTAHTSVWSLGADDSVRHRGDLFFTRPNHPGAYGDHATHLLRDGDVWRVATSTWSDFPTDPRARHDARVTITLGESTDDLTHGQHVVAMEALALPTAGPSVGVWDPHLVRDEQSGQWLVGYVSATRFFEFHPVLAVGTSLRALELRGAATDRRATEGTTLHHLGGAWHVLASDGRDNRRGVRGRFPVFDLDLREIGTLAAPYPTNLPWPTLVPPPADEPTGQWRLLTFDGTPTGGALPGYGTHGDLVVLHGTS